VLRGEAAAHLDQPGHDDLAGRKFAERLPV
jgi:hypothetical protein